YEQIKYAKADPAARAYLGAHTHFFTYGANLGTDLCRVPLCGIPWHATRPPVDLDLWPRAEGQPPCFTTIATWENKGKNIEFDGSRGEFTVAKDIYVRPNSGWFSDRAVCYLAAGRPVVTMRTGFTSYCAAGRGLFDYATHEEALAAIDAIAADYSDHSRAAREV